MISFKCQEQITLISGNSSLNNSYFCKSVTKENLEKINRNVFFGDEVLHFDTIKMYNFS